MAFNANFSSSPPSTPDKRPGNGQNVFSFGASNPSTTPAGPPPSSTGSYTPQGQPPSSFLGSSRMGSGSPLKPLSFSQQSSFGSPSSPAGFQQSFVTPQRSGLSNEYRPSPSTGFQAPIDDSEEEEEEEDIADYVEGDGQRYGDAEDYFDENDTGSMEEDAQFEDEDMDDYQPGTARPVSSGRGYDQRSASDLAIQPGALRRSREDVALGINDSLSQSLSRQKASLFGSIAKGLYTRMTSPGLAEPTELILKTERNINRLYTQDIGAMEGDDSLPQALITIPRELVNLWEDHALDTTVYHSEEYAAAIGPGPKATNFQKANYVAGLALQIHHPYKESSPQLRTVPQVMLEWLDEHHNATSSYLEDVQSHKPTPSNSRLFWSAIFSNLLRGKVGAVANLLRHAGWSHYRNELDHEQGFSGTALRTVEEVARRAVEVLDHCPAIRGDWDIRGSDWTLFRLRISQELESLKGLAEVESRGEPDSRGYVGSSLASRSDTYSRTAQKAQSRVPWDVFTNMVTLYKIAMGDPDAAIEVCSDWVEAVGALLVWWDEGKDDRRLALNRSQNGYRAASRGSDMDHYLRKLRRSFEKATGTDTSELAVNTADEVEVSLASVFEGDNEAVVGFLRGWSGPISCAFAEVASLGGWLPQAEPVSLINMGSLDQEDLDLLRHNSSPAKLDGAKDLTLITYAETLTAAGTLGPNIAGWELSIAILGRLDSALRSEEMVGSTLRGIALDSTDVVDKLWKLLNNVGMSHHAEGVAESYATRLAESSQNYGEALWYYALAHKTQKVKDVLDLLMSICLTQSTAYPLETELDDYLRRLVASPEDALTELSRVDFEAAELLHKTLSGYATLRKFYNLRDEAAVTKGDQSNNAVVSRKVEAVSALIAVISSSDDNIRGGLYDEERGAVVNVDFLLVLLGEAMVFVNQPEHVVTVSQIDVLLKAIEDLETVGSRVYSACAEFLELAVNSAPGLKGSSPMNLLRKTTSNSSGSSTFSMVGSSMLASQLKQSIGSSGVLVKGNIRRGWDWRHSIHASTTGDEILRRLRQGLAVDLANAWLDEADNMM